MFESRISAGATETLPSWEKPQPHTLSWSCDMEGHAQTCVARKSKLADKTTQQFYKVSFCATPWWPSLKGRRFQKCAHKSSWNVLTLARIGKPDILWPVNKLVRAVTRWTRACDKRLVRLISYIHHTKWLKAILSCGKILDNNADWHCSKILTLHEIWKTQNRLRGECCVFSAVTLLFP